MARVTLLVVSIFALAGLAAAQLLPSRAPAPGQPGGGKSVYDVLSTLPDTTTFVRLIRVARNDPTVASLTDPNFVGTVFVPTDNAFSKDERLIRRNLGLGTFDDLLRTPQAAARLIQNHIITGQALQTTQLTNGLKLRTALGEQISFSTGYLYGRYAQVSSRNAKLTSAGGDIPAGNAIIHRIDNVLVPKKQ